MKKGGFGAKLTDFRKWLILTTFKISSSPYPCCKKLVFGYLVTKSLQNILPFEQRGSDEGFWSYDFFLDPMFLGQKRQFSGFFQPFCSDITKSRTATTYSLRMVFL